MKLRLSFSLLLAFWLATLVFCKLCRHASLTQIVGKSRFQQSRLRHLQHRRSNFYGLMLHSALLVLFCTIAFICITIETDDVEPAAVKKCMCYVRYQQLFCQYAKELYFGHLISSADNCSQVHELRVNMHPKVRTRLIESFFLSIVLNHKVLKKYRWQIS